jgi:hypothetical protein
MNYYFFNPSSGRRVIQCVRTDGRTDSHHEPDTRFSELCVVSDVFPSVIYSMERGPS